MEVWTGFIWLRIGTSGGLLWTQECTLRFRKCWEVVEQLSDCCFSRRTQLCGVNQFALFPPCICLYGGKLVFGGAQGSHNPKPPQVMMRHSLFPLWEFQIFVKCSHLILHKYIMCQGSVVSIATGYRLDDQGVGVQVLVESRIFSSPRHPDQLWGPPNLLSNGYRGLFSRGKAAGACSWPLTSN
jgi:hypothetical protein